MDNKTSIGAIGGVIAVLAIAFIFALFPAESDDTIILVNKQGTDPVNSCAPGNGLILAQNLTDLCDVVIVSPVSDEVLKYNGTFWINQNESASDVTSVTSDSNNTVGVVPTSGDVILYPNYELLCSTVLLSDNVSIDCNNFEAKNNLIIKVILDVNANATNTGAIRYRFNNDNSTVYAMRNSFNGGADTTSTSTSGCFIYGGGNISTKLYSETEMHMSNHATLIKLGSGEASTSGNTTAGTAPSRHDFACKWYNLTDQITTVRINFFNGVGTPNFETGTRLTIWGYN